jgi:hypothetical protein
MYFLVPVAFYVESEGTVMMCDSEYIYNGHRFGS